MTPDLSVSLGSLKLKNPVLVAAGTFGYGLEFSSAVKLKDLGGIITKTVTRLPREGNAPPRLVETPSGMLNAVGLQNVGLEAFLSDKLPKLHESGTPVIVSILGETPQEIAEMVSRIDQAPGAAAIELNLSCPNIRHETTKQQGRCVVLVAQNAQLVEETVAACRRKTKKPLIAKLSPDVADLSPIAQAAEAAGADAITIANTYVGMSWDAHTRRSRLSAMTGGLSGPAIRALSVYRVWYTAPTIRIPIIGLGGIVRAEDAVEFFLAGARAVAVGTATFANPQAAVQVIQGLKRYLTKYQLSSVADLRPA